VNDYEQKIKQLIEASPSWEKDGGGVRGRTLAPLLGGASGVSQFDDFAPQQFNQQNTQLSFNRGQPDEGLVLSAPIEDTCIGLGLYIKSTGGSNPQSQVWVGAGIVAGELPSGFDPTDGKFIASGGSGNVWARVNIDQETGEIISVAVDGGGSTPQNTNTSFYYALGFYSYSNNAPTITNYGCGSLGVDVCRNWFRSTPPFYGVTFRR
jgi:hypothetical protein